jgi:putative ubiquitin-RnfH superfamily antitoxin RatB of RatAB toxin-antitoxin module
MPDRDATVEVAYALPGRQRVVQLTLHAGMTALDAVLAAGLEREFPEIASHDLVLGIYGRRVEATQVLRSGDRVEIYRPLKFDPRDARRRAAQAVRPARRGRGRS